MPSSLPHTHSTRNPQADRRCHKYMFLIQGQQDTCNTLCTTQAHSCLWNYASPRRNADAVTLFWPFQVQMCSRFLYFSASDNGQARDSDLTTAVECMCNALRTRPDSFRAHGSTTRTRLLLVDSGDRDQENCMRVRSGVSCSGHPLQSANANGVNATQQARAKL